MTETYAAFRIAVDNWRWAGVPFYLRTGKRLTRKKSEVVIQFKQPPLALFREASMAPPEPNQLVISIQPEETIKLEFCGQGARAGGGDQPGRHAVQLRRATSASEHQTGYETLLYDAMTGDRSLYKRADMIEAGWAVVDPILSGLDRSGECGLAQRYAAGSDGPGRGGWRCLAARGAAGWRPLCDRVSRSLRSAAYGPAVAVIPSDRDRGLIVSLCPPNCARIADSRRLAKSSSPRELKRAKSAAASTGTGTAASMATCSRPAPFARVADASGEAPSAAGSSASARAVRSSSHDPMTLPRRQSSAISGRLNS